MLMRRLIIPIVALVLAACSGTEEPATDDCGGQCFTPPAAECDGTNLIRYQVLGVCLDGTCEYTSDSSDCADDGQLCEEGGCVEPPDPCLGVECVTPPADSCADDARSATTYGEGVCVEGECEYPAIIDECRATEWCVDIECERQPCAGVECNEPPDASCEGTVFTTYVPNGECIAEDGTCEYTVETTGDCADTNQFCNGGVCEDIDPCDGVVCDAPPSDYCEGNTLFTAPVGVCASGECEYAVEEIRCADEGQICRDNTCRDRLPCEDVVCEEPPTDFCDGTEILVEHPATGTCLEDECNYESTFVNCFETGEVCDAGRCITPTACTGVVCDSPPEATCADGFVVTRYEEAGECVDGECIYTEAPYDCRDESSECIDGDCEFVDPCLGVVCNVAPESICVGSTSVLFGLPGVCDDGECEYLEDSEDCALSGDICADGVCQDRPDPCEDVSCEPLAPNCDDGDRVSYEGAGTCVGGACDYSLVEEREVCSSGCTAGVCVPAGTLFEADELIISEIMLVPDGDSAFFFEIQDMVGSTDLSGLVLFIDALEPFTLPEGTEIEPFGVLVIGANADAAPVVDIVWPELTFAPAGAVLTIQGSEVVDTVVANPSAGFPGTAGRSAQRSGVDITDDVWCTSWETQETIIASSGLVNGSCDRGFVVGELYFTEIMPNGVTRPGGSPEVWFELFGTFEDDTSLDGLIVTSSTHRWVLRDAVIDAEDWAVAGADAGVNVSPNIYWGDNFSFGVDDILTIYNGSTVLDVVDFSGGGWGYSEGNALGLDIFSAHTENDNPSAWCTTSTTYGRGANTGTPYDQIGCD